MDTTIQYLLNVHNQLLIIIFRPWGELRKPIPIFEFPCFLDYYLNKKERERKREREVGMDTINISFTDILT